MTATPNRERKQSEDRLHLSISQEMRVRGFPPGKLSPGGLMWFSIEHRNAASVAEGLMRKAKGVIAGIPDTVALWPGHTLWIELKADDGTLSDAQEGLHPKLIACGHAVEICRSVPEWFKILARHGAPL